MTGRRRYWFWLLLLIPVGIGLGRLRFDVEVLNLLPDDLPAVKGLKLYQQNFANARELIMTVRANDAETAENSARSLAERLRGATNLISAVTWQPPWLEHPDQAAELVAHLWFNQRPEIFGALTNRLSAANLPATLSTARERLASSMSPSEMGQLGYDPYGLTQLPEDAGSAAPGFGQGQEMFASADGTFRILFVQSTTDLTSYRDCLAWLKSVKGLVQSARESDRIPNEVVVGYTGRPAFVGEIAGGMERDITSSVGSTVVIIVFLFWWAHRRWRPLVWLLALLILILTGTLAIGGLIFGTLSVISVGFAAILLGLAVDYGLLLYQESLVAPEISAAQLRRAVGPGIVWSAVTTAGAFLILNLGGLPGLAQLGSLVAIGISLAAVVMLYLFLVPLLPSRTINAVPARQFPALDFLHRPIIAWSVTGFVALAGLIILLRGRPALDRTANALRPRNSAAYATLEEIKLRLGRTQEPFWVLISGHNESEVARRLDEVQPVLSRARTNHEITGFTLPSSFWPRPELQNSNRAIAQILIAQRTALREAARAHGFTDNALALTEKILDTWQRAASSDSVFWPTNSVSRWVTEKLVARTPGQLLALGLIYPSTNSVAENGARISRLSAELPRDNVWLAGWERLGTALLEVVANNLWHVLVPMSGLLLVSLWLAFRRVSEVALSLFTLAFSMFCLFAIMRLAGWSWNLLNLMALPLLLGSGVDYSIHMQLALRRHGGDIAETRRSVGRALLLCAGTTVAGFGSNIWSSNGGLVTLGQVCATGIALAYLTSTWLLPIWWRTLVQGPTARIEGFERKAHGPAEGDSTTSSKPSAFNRPSSLYRAEVWRLGVAIACKLSPGACSRLSKTLGDVYWKLCVRRREIVIQNLLPAIGGDRVQAEKISRELFRHFAQKLADLWRYEGGLPIDDLFGELTGWEHFQRARSEKRGVLLLTPHLGNWEFGAPLLARRGVDLLVITLAEPHDPLTGLRQTSRARWGIETLVIGRDPFAFLEIIRRLEGGAFVALLVDRPAATSAVTVKLFGRPFAASIAAAELARASGCRLLPVYLPRTPRGYAAHILPPIPYDRGSLRQREARHKLTQEIMRAFEPVIHQHLDQWYHFIPIWPNE